MKCVLTLLMLLVIFGCSENKKDYNKTLTSDSEELKTESIVKKTIETRKDSPDSSIKIFDKSGKLITVMQNEITPDNYWDKLVIDRDEEENEVEYRLYRKWKKYYNSKNENLSDVYVTKYKNEYDSNGNLIEQTYITDMGLTSITNYTYDSLNQISNTTKITYKGGFSGGRISEGRICEKDKIVGKRAFYDDKGNTIYSYDYEFDPEGKIFVRRGWEYRCEYDSDGKELSSVTRGANGKIYYKDSTFYNDKGEKTYTLQYYKDDMTSKTTYEYYE